MIHFPQEQKTYREPGRNDKCLCGSGKKYKDCCLSKAKQEQDRIRVAIEDMRKHVLADAKSAIEKAKRDGTADNFTENEKAALGILAGCEVVPDKSRMQEGIVSFHLKYPIAVIVKDGKIGVQEQRPRPEQKPPSQEATNTGGAEV